MPSEKAPGVAGALAREYGRAKSIEELLNRAIRAEIPGGPELLDAIEISHKLVKVLSGPVQSHSQDLHDTLLLSRDKLRAGVLRKWERKLDQQ